MNRIFLFLFSALLLLSGCMNDLPHYSEFSTRYNGERTQLFQGNREWIFDDFLLAELKNHPEMECADLYKFCAQAAYGIDNARNRSREIFQAAFDDAEPENAGELITVTSPDCARIDIAAWKAAGLAPEWLYRMSIMESAFDDAPERMKQYLDRAEKLITQSNIKFSSRQFRKFADAQSTDKNNHFVRHSDAYKRDVLPYRIISTRYMQTIEILKTAAKLPKKKSHIIAIDGRAASGKTTISKQLKIILNAQTIHMDDFFLPPQMRTNMRYAQAGGNVHYERFKEEVLSAINKNNAFSYRIFDCKKQCFNGSRMIWPSEWIIVEGAYSHHPEFGNYADLKIFYDISPQEQMRRIILRNGSENAEIFRKRWIPFEENYIKTFNIRKNADIVLK